MFDHLTGGRSQRTNWRPWIGRWPRSSSPWTARSWTPTRISWRTWAHARRDPGAPPQPVRRPGRARERRVPAILDKLRPGPSRMRVQAHRQGRTGSLDPGVLCPGSRPGREADHDRQDRHRHHGAESAPPRPRRSDRRPSPLARARDRLRARWDDPERQPELPRRGRLQRGRDRRPPPWRVRHGSGAVQRGLSRVRRRWHAANSSPPSNRRSEKAAGNLDPGDLQPDQRRQWSAHQGGQVRNRHHRAGPRTPAPGRGPGSDRHGSRRDRAGRHGCDAADRDGRRYRRSVSDDIQAVASGAEQLSISVYEISRQVSHAPRLPGKR